MVFKKLVLSGIDSKYFRTKKDQEFLKQSKWRKEIRPAVMLRDSDVCNYCGYKHKSNHVHHINGDHKNNSFDNLEVICAYCHMITHSGLFSYLHRKVVLFEKSDYNQNQIQQISTEMRKDEKTDKEIIEFLGLKNRKYWKPNEEYLSKLFGFVTSKKLRNSIHWETWFGIVHSLSIDESERNRLLDIEDLPVKSRIRRIYPTLQLFEVGKYKLTQEVSRILRDVYDSHKYGYTLTDERRIQLDKEEIQRRKNQEYDSGIDIIEDDGTN